MPPGTRLAPFRAALPFGAVAAILCVLASPRTDAGDTIVTFNELHYHPAPDPGGPEWIELHNQMSIRIDLGRWTIAGGIEFTFPEGTTIEPGEHLVVSSVAGSPSGALGPFTGRLDNAGETVRLLTRHGRLMDEVAYNDRGEWPSEPDGSGPSLAKRLGSLGSADPASWTASAEPGGTPGDRNFPDPGEAGQRTVFLRGGPWKYEASGAEPPADWNRLSFRDSAWPTGNGELGSAAVTNGGFEADTFTISPGLVSGNGPITGWSPDPASATNRTGLNRPPGEQTFADNGAVPGGRNVAFILGGSPCGLVQEAQGLQAGSPYVLHFRMNAQTGGTATVAATVDGTEALSAHALAPVDTGGRFGLPFRHAVSAPFTAGSDRAAIAIESRGTGPTAVLLDEVRVAPVVVADAFGGPLPGPASGSVPHAIRDYASTVILHARFRGGVDLGFVRTGSPAATPSADGTLWAEIDPTGAVRLHNSAAGGPGPIASASPRPGFDPSADHTLAMAWTPSLHSCDVMVDGATVLQDVDLAAFPDVRGISGRAPSGASRIEAVAAAESVPSPVTPLPSDRPVYLRRSFAFIGGVEGPSLLLDGTLRGNATIYLNGAEISSLEDQDGALGLVLPADALAFGANVLAVRLEPSPSLPGVRFDAGLTLIEPGAPEPPREVFPPGPVVINEILYHHRPTYEDPARGIAFAEDPTEWIELHNRTDAPVDLGGWRVSDAVDYRFPEGTLLPARGFLVIDQDDFSGSLANAGDRIRLRDDADAVIDEVRYFDDRRWPADADGAGSSLELVDPDADNDHAQSWSASDESARAEWRTYTYRGSGAEPPNSNNPDNWREFLMGFLDAGEALVDDISVIEDPDGTPRQLIRNGDFEGDSPGAQPAAWRILGTHRLSRVVRNPDGAGNVLHLVATGEAEHTYNVASTTLADNRLIFPNREYEISFRAKWLRGSPQLNTRLYLNRAARTTILAQPATAGTPGAPNGTAVANAGPTLSNLRHSPLVPEANQPVRITVDAHDPDGILSLTLFYSAGGRDWIGVTMGGDASGRHAVVLPGFADRELVQFFVAASDRAGAASAFPPRGPNSRAFLKVGDAGVSGQPVANKLRLYMLPEEVAELHNRVHSVSNFRWGGTLIDNDREVYYDVGVRLRAAPYGRQGPRAGWNIRVGDDRPFRGVHSSIVIDGALNMPRGDGTGWIETTIGASLNEMIYNVIANRSGSVDANYDDIAFFAAPRPQDNRIAQLKMARFNNEYLDSVRPNGSDGTVFKQELIYYPTTTVDGNPESLKNPYNMVLQVDIRNMGGDKEAYRHNYLIRGNRDRDDYSAIMEMGRTFSASNIELADRADASLDVESWMRVLALNALTGLADTYNNGLAHNIVFYARPSDNRVVLMPWDQDHAFYYATTSSIYGQGSHRVRDLIAVPRNRRLYAQHLLDFCHSGFDPGYLAPWITHLNQVAGQAYATNFLNWVNGRRNYVLSQLNSEFQPVEFAVTTNNGDDIVTDAPGITLRGQGWIDVHRVMVARAGGEPVTLSPTWLDTRRWEVPLSLLSGANAFAIEALDRQGNLVGTDSITVTNTGSVEPAAPSNFSITEVHYHPSPPTQGEISAGFTDADDFEFIEFQNIGGRTIDLAGVLLGGGIDFAFDAGSIRQLAPGARLVLVRNFTAFVTRNGAGIPVAGRYGRSLANEGETLTVTDRIGQVIQSFRYNDRLPWPEEADGNGRSLTLIQPAARPDPGAAESWRPSVAVHGSPGRDDAIAPDGFADPLGYALTGPPEAAPPGPASGAAEPSFRWPERLGADSVRLVPEVSLDGMKSWLRDPGDRSLLETIATSADDSGSRHVTVAVHIPAGTGDENVFLRLAVEDRTPAANP